MKKPKTAVIDTVTHARDGVVGVEVALPAQSAAKLPIPRSQIKSFARSGDDLVLTTVSGEVVVMHGFFVDQPGDSSELFAQAETDYAADAVLLADADDANSGALLAQTMQADATSTTASATPGFIGSGDSLASASTDTSTGASTGAGAAASGAAHVSLLSVLPLIVGGGIAAKGSASQHSPVIDTPTAPTVDGIRQNADGTLTVSGQARPNDTVTVTYPDGSSTAAVVDASGNYTAKSSTVQSTGDVTVTDSNGSHSISQHWTDTTAPQALTVSLANDTGDSNNDQITSDGTLAFTGIEPGARVEYSIDGAIWNPSFTPVEGANTVQVRQTDVAGNASAATNITFTLDTTAPAGIVTITSATPTWVERPVGPLEPGQSTTDVLVLGPGATVIGTLSAPMADGSQSGVSAESVQVSLDGGKTWANAVVNGTTWSYTSTWGYPLDVNLNEVQARVVDVAGNAGQIATRKIDDTPLIRMDGISDDTGASASDFTTSDNTLVFNGSLNAPLPSGLAVQIRLVSGSGVAGEWKNASVNGAAWTYDNTANPMSDGYHRVEMRIVDGTGAQVGYTNWLPVIVDTKPPSQTVTIDDNLHATGAIPPGGEPGVTYALTGTISAALADGRAPGESAESVQVSLDGGQTWHDATIGDDGTSWSYVFTSLPASGNFTAVARVIDQAGNAGTETTKEFTNSNLLTAPTVALLHDTGDSATDNITNDGTLNLTGVKTGATVEYSIDGTTWNATVPAWVQGSNTVYVRQTDAAGNVSDASQPLTFTYDTSLSAAAQGIQIGWISPDTSRDFQTMEWPPLGRDFITSAQNLSVGAMIPGNVGPLNSDERVQINLGDGVWHETTVSFDQYFLYDATGITLEPGTHSFQARVVDTAGNVIVSKSQEVVIDITPPVALGVTLANDTGASGSDQITSDGALALTGIEPGARVEYSIDGTIWNPSFTPVEGANTVQVRQTDVAGNVSTSSSITFTLDKTAPAAPTLTFANDTINVAGLETAAGSTWQYQIDGGAWVDGSGTTIPVSALTTDSSHTVLVKQTDVAGNVSTPATLTFTLDTTAPPAPALALQNDTGLSATDLITQDGTINVTGLETAAGTTWQYQIGDGAWLDGTGTTIPASAFTADGSYTVHAHQINAAGKVSNSGTLTFTRDTTPPAAPTVVLKDDTGISATDKITSDPTLTVSTETGATVEYSSDGGTTWSANFTVVEGDNTVLVRQTDVAGNVSTSSSITFTLDQTAPVAPALTLAQSNDTINVAGLETAAGSTWQYRIDGGAWVNGTGTTISVSTLTTDGTHTVLVKQTDIAGNVSNNATLTFTLDPTAPPVLTLALQSDTGASDADRITKDGTIQVTGLETAAGTTWQYQIGDGAWLDGTGTTIPASVFTADGSYTVHAHQINAAGKVSNSATLTFTRDTTAPAAPTVALANDSGISATDKMTNDATLNAGGIEIGATVEYSRDGGQTWSTNYSAAEGDNTILLRQTDVAGNVSTSSSISFTLDKTAPAAPILTFANDTINVAGLETATGATWQYQMDNGAWETGTGATIPISALTTDGAHTVLVKQTDVAGNVSTPATLTFTLDPTAPPAPALALQNDTGKSDADRITKDGTIQVTDLESAAGTTWQYQIGNGAWVHGTGTTIPASAFTADGAYTVHVHQISAAGKVSNSGSLTFTLDTTAPAAPTVALKNDTGASATDNITSDPTLNVGGLESGATVEFSRDGGTTWSTTPNAAAGVNTILVRQTDVAGNVSDSGSITFTLETSSQTLTIDSYTDDQTPKTGTFAFTVPTNDTAPVLNGTAASGALVTISQSGTTIGTTAADAGGKWHYNLPTQSEGTHSYTATAQDGAGQTETANVTLTVDTTPPTQGVTIDSYIDDVDWWDGQTGVFTFERPTDDNTPIFNGTFTGTLAANEYVAIYRGDAYAGSANVNAGAHTWQFQDLPLANGSYTYMARVEDLAGNASTIQATVTLTVDMTRPPSPAYFTAWSFIDDVGPIKGTFGPYAWTDDTRPILTGQAWETEPGDTVKIYEGTTFLGRAIWDYGGHSGGWSFALPETTEGSHSYTGVITDADGYTKVVSDPFTLVVYGGDPPTYTDNVGSITGTFNAGTLTDDTTPTLNGKLAATDSASFVRIYEGTELLGSAAVDTANGTWRFTVPETTEGTHSYTAVLTDADGKEGTTLPPFTLTVDLTPPPDPVTLGYYTDDVGPITGIFGPDSWTDDTTPTLTGWGGGGGGDFSLHNPNMVRIYEGATFLGTATYMGYGEWRFTVPATTEGVHSYTAVPTDAAGNEGPPTDPFTLVVHGGDPMTYTDNVGSITGTFYAGTTTDDKTPTLNGTVSDIAGAHFVRIYEGTQLLGSTVVDTVNGKWRFTVPETTEGRHGYTAVITDANGQEVTTMPPFTLTVDTTPPNNSVYFENYIDDFGSVTGIFGPDTTTDDTTPTLRVIGGGGNLWSINSNIVRIYEGATFLGTATFMGDGLWNFTVPETTAGTHTYKAVMTDAAGNEGLSSNSFTIIITAPTPPSQTLTIDSYTDNQMPKTGNFAFTVSTNDTTPVLNGTAASGALVTISQSGTTIGSATADAGGNWHYNLPTQSEGTHSYTATAQDGAGQTETANVTLTVDTTPPTQGVTINNYTDDVSLYGSETGVFTFNKPTDDTTPVLNGTYTGMLAVTEFVAIYRNDAYAGSASVNTDNHTWQFQDSLPADGSYNYVARVEDLAGNASTIEATAALTVDTKPPPLIFIDSYTDDQMPKTGNFASTVPTNDTTPVLNGTTLTGTLVTISQSGTAIGSTTADANGKWHYELPTLSEGTYSYTASAQDADGTVTTSAPFTIIVRTDNGGEPVLTNLVSFADFSDLSHFVLSESVATGNATPVIDPDGAAVLRLTPSLSWQSGAAFLDTAVPSTMDGVTTSFSTSFQMRMSDSAESNGDGADGMVFVIADKANTIGGAGGSIGYGGISPSVGIEFDTWDNGDQDSNDGNHVGINLNGSMTSVQLQHFPTLFDDGEIVYAWVDYNGMDETLSVYVATTPVRPAAPLIEHAIDLAGIFDSGSYYFGFTAGTGDLHTTHDVLAWSLDVSAIDAPTPMATHLTIDNGGFDHPVYVLDGTLNLSLADVLSDAKALTHAGSAQQVRVNGDSLVSTVHLTDGVGTGANQWQATGTATVDGVLYDVYHNAAQGASTVADLLIQHGISVT